MSAATEKAKIIAKLKAKAKGSWKKVKDKAPKVRTQGLPPGIKNGVARFVSYDLGETKKDKDPYFKLNFVCVRPEEHLGRRFSVFHFINDSEYATVEDNLENLSGDIQHLGGDTSASNDVPDICPILDECAENKPFIKFDTWAKKSNGETAYAIKEGVTDEDELEELTNEVPEEEVEDEEEAKPAKKSSKATPNKAKKKSKPVEEEVEEEEEEESEDEEVEDEEDTEEDEEADEEESEDEEEGSDEEGDDFEPALEDIYGYKDPKLGKKAKTEDCEVIKVTKKTRTVDLKHVKSKKVFKAVSWDDLESPE